MSLAADRRTIRAATDGPDAERASEAANSEGAYVSTVLSFLGRIRTYCMHPLTDLFLCLFSSSAGDADSGHNLFTSNFRNYIHTIWKFHSTNLLVDESEESLASCFFAEVPKHCTSSLLFFKFVEAA